MPTSRIRAALAGGGPNDGAELRRLVLRATSRIADPAEAERLNGRLNDELLDLLVIRELGDEMGTKAATDAVDELLAEIERMSRPS